MRAKCGCFAQNLLLSAQKYKVREYLYINKVSSCGAHLLQISQPMAKRECSKNQ